MEKDQDAQAEENQKLSDLRTRVCDGVGTKYMVLATQWRNLMSSSCRYHGDLDLDLLLLLLLLLKTLSFEMHPPHPELIQISTNKFPGTEVSRRMKK